MAAVSSVNLKVVPTGARRRLIRASCLLAETRNLGLVWLAPETCAGGGLAGVAAGGCAPGLLGGLAVGGVTPGLVGCATVCGSAGDLLARKSLSPA